MYEVTSKTRKVNGVDVLTRERKIINSNILSVEDDINGYQSDDTSPALYLFTPYFFTTFEIKLGTNQIDKAAQSLIELRNNILKNSGIAPSVLCVICGMSNVAYIKPDGVFVVSIMALKN